MVYFIRPAPVHVPAACRIDAITLPLPHQSPASMCDACDTSSRACLASAAITGTVVLTGTAGLGADAGPTEVDRQIAKVKPGKDCLPSWPNRG
jgi:hypothetical protein|eukprot:COSAG01_NODE_4349_length_5115_cov_2.076555_7_plen_93_part_00